MLFFAISLHMANGATFGIVPFVNEKNVGLVSGIVGAGGNLGGMAFGFLFKSDSISYVQAFTFIGFVVIGISFVVLATKFYKVKNLEKIEGANVVTMA
jgi:NNP family nitrate/nitrite transporter-like MFS transporter